MHRDHFETLEKGAGAWNDWRRATPGVRPDLSGADLSGRDLAGFDLRGTDFAGATFHDADLAQASLLGADLAGADLSRVQHLLPAQLASARLAGATLPAPVSFETGLEVAADASKSAQDTFLLLLGACLYSWLTISGTSDAMLLTNSAVSPLPIIGTEIPILWFFVIVPAMLFILYLYWQTQLFRMWTTFARLPAVYPDGSEGFWRIKPWLLTRLYPVRSSSIDGVFGNVERRVAGWMVWWLLPATLAGFWLRTLSVRRWPVVLWLVLLLVLAWSFSRNVRRLAGSIVRGEPVRGFRWQRFLALRGPDAAGWSIASGVVVLFLLSIAAIGRLPGRDATKIYADLDPVDIGVCSERWPPYDHPDLRYETISVRASPDADRIARGADLRGADLRFGRLFRAYLANADLREAALQCAHLQESDLRFADFGEASLVGADLKRALLSGANLGDRGTGGILEREPVKLCGADLRGAELRGTDLRGADLTGALMDCWGTGPERLCTVLAGADLSGADLERANLGGADLGGATLAEARLIDTDLREVLGLSQAQLDTACGSAGTRLGEGMVIDPCPPQEPDAEA